MFRTVAQTAIDLDDRMMQVGAPVPVPVMMIVMMIMSVIVAMMMIKPEQRCGGEVHDQPDHRDHDRVAIGDRSWIEQPRHRFAGDDQGGDAKQ